MKLEQQNAVVMMLANDALEAANDSHPNAAILLFDAGLSILVTRHKEAAARREMGAMFSEYVTTQIEAVIAAGGAA
jgi:hypothetical protein